MTPIFGRKKEPKEAFDEKMEKAQKLFDSTKRWKSKSKNLLKHIEKAQEIAETVEVDQEDMVRLWSMKGSVYYMGYRNLPEALNCYNNALSLNPRDVVTLVNRVEVLYGMEKYDEIIEDCEKVLELLPQERDEEVISKLPQLRPGHRTIMKGDQAAIFERAHINQRHAWALVGKGISLIEQNKPEEAMKFFDRALKINPRDPEAWGQKAFTLAKLDKFGEAISCFEKALSIAPEYEWAWFQKGLALGELNKPREAMECYDRALKINPRNYQTWVNKGIILNSLGNPEEAIISYDRALKINQRDPLAWYNKGLALGRLSKFKESVKCYDKALKMFPRFALAWYVKGMALKSIGKLGEAEECFQKATEINPSLRNKVKNL